MADVDTSREDVLDAAWDLARQLVLTGVMVLQNGNQIKPGDDGFGDFTRAVNNLLHFKKPKVTKMPALDQWAAARTDQVPDAS